MARMAWKVVSFPLIAGLLLLLKPIVDALCAFVLVFGLVAAVAFELSAVGPRFPFLQIVGMALGFGLFAALYHREARAAPLCRPRAAVRYGLHERLCRGAGDGAQGRQWLSKRWTPALPQ